MKGRENRGAPPADLLVCFPTRSHLTLMPKPICSPARAADANKRSLYSHHHLKKSSFRGGGGGGGQSNSPTLWSKSKHVGSDISEPTSPKVTCAGQIKVRPKPGCKNWQSVMAEIEKLHSSNNKTNKKKIKKPTWVEALGFKKDVMQFLNCLRNVRLDFRCFGSFPTADITSSEDEDEDVDEDVDDEAESSSKTVFSKWFMVLQDDQNSENNESHQLSVNIDAAAEPCAVPPPNALLLMRCRSAPAKSWLQERDQEHNMDKGEEKEVKMVEEEEEISRKNREDNMVVMRYDSDFYKLSTDIAKETWVIGGTKNHNNNKNQDPISRSRSCKR